MSIAILAFVYFVIGQFFVGMWETMAKVVGKPFPRAAAIFVALAWPIFGARALGNRFG